MFASAAMSERSTSTSHCGTGRARFETARAGPLNEPPERQRRGGDQEVESQSRVIRDVQIRQQLNSASNFRFPCIRNASILSQVFLRLATKNRAQNLRCRLQRPPVPVFPDPRGGADQGIRGRACWAAVFKSTRSRARGLRVGHAPQSRQSREVGLNFGTLRAPGEVGVEMRTHSAASLR